MSRDEPADVLIRLIRLIRRVPVHVIDVPTAEAKSDHAAIAYARAIEAWRAEAAEAIADARLSSPAHGRHAAPDAFARTATVSALMRPQAAE